MTSDGCAPLAHFITLGCAKNEVDTRDMRARLEEAGIACTEDLDRADVVIVNTCSFIQAAVEESIEAILDVLDDDRVIRDEVPVVIAGCMPSRYGDDLASELPEAANFVPCSKEDDIASIVKGSLGIEGDLKHDGMHTEGISELAPTFAYVKISDGCDRFCSYCTIPYIRGRYHSFSYESIARDVAELSRKGVKEIVLIGQDTGIWGSDLGETDTLAQLMRRLAKEFPENWFRVMYTQPEHVSDELLEVMAEHGNIAPYLDIPFQHCTPSILAAMNRKGSAEDFLELIARARNKVPGIVIRTTLMVGFPGESEQDFEELVDFVEEAEFEYAGIFAYSREEGTKAAEMPDQVPDLVKEERYARLRDIADSVSNRVIAGRIGSDVEVLVEGVEEDGQLFGRSMLQAPEVDGVTFIDDGRIGRVVSSRIEDTLFYDMEASSL